MSKPLCYGVGHDSEALTKFVDEAERELAVAHCRTNQEEPRRFRALVLRVQERGGISATPTAFLLLVLFNLILLIAPLEQLLCHAQSDAPAEAGAEYWRLGSAQSQLGALLGDFSEHRSWKLLAIPGQNLVFVLRRLMPPSCPHEVSAAFLLLLHLEDAQRREKPRRVRRGASLPQPLHSVRGKLGGRVVGGKVPEGRRGYDRATLSVQG
mmetsp:Transcript_6354/g.12145  ORF Transcript_6354/g.12145 Transcript_6354/m.12145 type:complete len:210 (-) Transcript_6354:604-1233(-)